MTKKPVIDRSILDLELEHVAAARRGTRWKETLNEFFYRHENNTSPDFRSGQFTGTGTDEVRIATFASDPMFCERTAWHSARDCIDGYFIVTPVKGEITLMQRGRDVVIKPGQFSLLGTEGAHRFLQPGVASFHGILIPGDIFRKRRPDIDDHTCKDFTATGALQSMFVDYADSFCRNAIHLEDRALKRTSEHLTDMLALMVEGVDQSSDETAVQNAHRRRALQVIDANFHEPGLNASAVAQALGLSERYIQKIFATNGETVGGLVRRRRILEACQLLDRRGETKSSIATVAYMTGFVDPAYFSRVFRRDVGMSPLDWCLRPKRPRTA